MKFWNKSLFLILAFAFLLRLNFALFTPNWQAADEYPHFFLIKYFAIYDNFPKYDQKFPYYEAFQPPLYYQIMSVIYKIFKNYDQPSPAIDQEFDPDTLTRPLNLTLFVLRIISVAFGIITLILIYAIAYHFFKNYYAIYVLLVASSLPSFVINSSSVTNDTLANVLGALILFLIFRNFNNEQKKLYLKSIVLGIILGLSLQTKANLYPFFLIVLASLFFSQLKRKEILRYYLVILFVAVLISINYFYTNYNISGNIFPISPEGEKGYLLQHFSFYRLYHGLRNYFWSFWAAAGRIYQIHLEAYYYIIIFLPITVIALIGNIRYLITKYKNDIYFRQYIVTLFSALLFTLVAIYYYLIFEYHTAWGRYVYPNLAAYLVLLIFGIVQIIKGKYIKLVFLTLFGIQVLINLKFIVELSNNLG